MMSWPWMTTSLYGRVNYPSPVAQKARLISRSLAMNLILIFGHINKPQRHGSSREGKADNRCENCGEVGRSHAVCVGGGGEGESGDSGQQFSCFVLEVECCILR